jgi:hypothetical protein
LVSFQGCKDGLTYAKSINIVQPINRIMNQNHKIISIDAEKNPVAKFNIPG